jgi:hypothetical protein
LSCAKPESVDGTWNGAIALMTSWRPVSSTGYWIVGALGQDALDALLVRVGPAVSVPPPGSRDSGWWCAIDELDVAEPARPGHRAFQPTDAAVRFQEDLLGLRPDPDVLDACIAVIGEAAEMDRFVVAVRKGDPVAALYYGLGSAAAQRMPGRAGCFLLDAHAQAELAELAQLLDVPVRERARFADRVSRWLEAMGDQPDLDPLMLLEGPLRLARRAREARMGLLAVMQWH